MPLNVMNTASRFRPRRRRKRNAPLLTETSIAATPTTSLTTPSSPLPGPPPEKPILKKQRKHSSTTNKIDLAENDQFDFCDATASSSSSSSTSSPPNTIDRTKEATGRSTNRIKQVGAKHDGSMTSLSSSKQCPVSLTSLVQHAVALDTRFLDTKEGREEYERFHQEVGCFLNSTRPRGLAPSFLAWTEPSHDSVMSSSSSSSPSSSAYTPSLSSAATVGITVCSQKMTSSNVAMHGDTLRFSRGTPIRPSMGDAKSNHPSVMFQIPKEHFADTTWTLFGDLVESIVAERMAARKTDSTDGQVPSLPLRVTILTSDASSFLNTDDLASHKRGMNSFWERVKPSFRSVSLQSIQIVIVMGETTVASQEAAEQGVSAGLIKVVNTEQNEDGARAGIAWDGSTVTPLGIRQDPCDDETLCSKRVAAICALLKSMVQHFESKAEEDYTANRSRIQFESKLRPRVDITLSKIDCDHVGFSRLLQKWSRDALTFGTDSNGSGGWRHTLRFQLPETADYDACVISLQASYKNMPFPLNSPQTHALCIDLDLLSRAKLDVLQLVPITSIDASLMYGVPIGLRSGLEESVDRHLEMGLLVRSLFKNLGSKDCALVVRSRGPLERSSGCMFHSTENQYFLLMPEMIQSSTSSGTASCRGVLYRIVGQNSLMEEASPTEGMGSLNEIGENPFSEYMEVSLDGLKCSPLNPFLLKDENNYFEQPQQEQKRVRWIEGLNEEVSCTRHTLNVDNKGPASTNDETEKGSFPIEVTASQSVWNDDSGVGSLMKDPGIERDKDSVTLDCNGKGSDALSVECIGENPLAINTNSIDDVEDSDHEQASSDEIHKRLPTEILPKMRNPRKEDSETEWNDSDDSTSSSDSGTDDGTIGTFEYTLNQE